MNIPELAWLAASPFERERPAPPEYTHYVRGNGSRVKMYRGTVDVENAHGDIVSVPYSQLRPLQGK